MLQQCEDEFRRQEATQVLLSVSLCVSVSWVARLIQSQTIQLQMIQLPFIQLPTINCQCFDCQFFTCNGA
jgi:hypothetical protein